MIASGRWLAGMAYSYTLEVGLDYGPHVRARFFSMHT